MYSLLLAIIYMAFISLGLPDSLLGSAWPVMRLEFGAPISYAGLISMLISAGTIVSSLLSDRVTKKFGTGLVTAVSVGMTAAALLGFSLSKSVVMLCLIAIPYGLGAGAIDAALNNYVALHYSARHMSWLHCFWGVGCSVSPFIMGAFLTRGANWRGGYRAVSLVQFVLTAVLFLSLPLWKKLGSGKSEDEDGTDAKSHSMAEALKIPGVSYILIAFFSYCAAETTAGLWASSYLVEFRAVDEATAARFASLFYLGITAGRFLNGFIADRAGDRRMIRVGIAVMLFATLMIILPLKTDLAALAGLVIFGLGCAPVYPSVIHATPANFGAENSQIIIGIQMASAYLGSTLMPPTFGLIAKNINIGLYPVFLAFFTLSLLLTTEMLNRLMASRK